MADGSPQKMKEISDEVMFITKVSISLLHCIMVGLIHFTFSVYDSLSLITQIIYSITAIILISCLLMNNKEIISFSKIIITILLLSYLFILSQLILILNQCFQLEEPRWYLRELCLNGIYLFWLTSLPCIVLLGGIYKYSSYIIECD